jgi:hypothetical protein
MFTTKRSEQQPKLLVDGKSTLKSQIYTVKDAAIYNTIIWELLHSVAEMKSRGIILSAV